MSLRWRRMRREFLGASLYYSLDTLSCLLALLNAIAVVTFRSKMVLGKANCFSSLASLFCKNAFCGFASEKTASQVSWREFLFAGRSLLFVCLFVALFWMRLLLSLFDPGGLSWERLLAPQVWRHSLFSGRTLLLSSAIECDCFCHFPG